MHFLLLHRNTLLIALACLGLLLTAVPLGVFLF
jgi:hypothetical protein